MIWRPILCRVRTSPNSRAEVRDVSFRIMTATDGIHVFNRDGHHHRATMRFPSYPKLDVEADGAHAFYLGTELAKAEIAFALGKRYTQDEPLDWGCAVDKLQEDTGPSARSRSHLAAKA